MNLARLIVDQMIARSVRARFRNVYWRLEDPDIESPIVFYANHHGWMDGYLMYLALKRLKLNGIAWVEEYEEFPLFRTIGALPFPVGDKRERTRTILRTIRLLRARTHSLVLFPEGVLHRPGPVLEFMEGMAHVVHAVPEAKLVPVGIRYEMSLHERPEAWLEIGSPHSFSSLTDCREKVEALLQTVLRENGLQVLHGGTPSINERMGLKRNRS